MAIAPAAGLADAPLRGVVSTPVGSAVSWSAHGWSASVAGGSTRDGHATLRTVTLATPSGVGVELSDLVERGQVLGTSGDAGFDLSGSRTTLATLVAQRDVAGVRLAARATMATTRASGGSALLRFTAPLLGTAFALNGTRALFGGLATVGIASPLRLERARAAVLAPLRYDLVSGALTSVTTVIDVAPTARELDLELGWTASLGGSSRLRLGIAHAIDAGHVAGARDTAGLVTLAIR